MDVLSYVCTHDTDARGVQKEQRMSTTLQQTTYDQCADRYAQSYAQPRTTGFNSNLDLVIPRLVEVVGRVDGLTVLDAGCSEGSVSRSLVGTATRVVGIDIVPQLIAYARARDLTHSLTDEVHDLSRPLPHYEHTFDLIVSNLVLNDVPDYHGFITMLRASLKPRGRIVLSLNNPYSALLREKVDNYFDTEAVAQYGFGPATGSPVPVLEGHALYHYSSCMMRLMASAPSGSALAVRWV
jgi:2-polyprenyl-3-methyl-5-hydroxy-6-metoxy-1,4-benzoquinol methylase